MAETREEFIKKVYKQTYQMAQDNGLPHDFIMAQVIQETGWGDKVLKDTNNIFNIKTGSSWKGKKSTHNVWEIIDGKKVWVDADFRKYDSYGDSVDDWLKFLKENKRYKALFEKENLSTAEFAKKIHKAGYATDPNYAKNIVNITKGKTYKRLIGKAKASYDNESKVDKNISNDAYVVKKGDYLEKIANKYNITVKQLLEINPQILNKNNISIGQRINISKQEKIAKTKREKVLNTKRKDEEAPSNNTWDKWTNQRIQKIHPLIRSSAINFINDVQKKLDIKLRVTTGMRSVKKQNDLYKQGRSLKGKKVTWVTGGYSYHNYGLAIDVVEIKNKKANWATKWKDIAEVGKDKGFEWGGDWKDVSDKPHFQKTFGYTTKQLKKRLESGKIKNGFVDIEGVDTPITTVDTKIEKIVARDNNVYSVKKGDNLSKISKKHNISLPELLKLNPQIEDKNKISIGQSIYISKPSPIININLENKSQKLFKKLGLRHEKIPTLNHNQNLPENIEGMYKKDNLSLKKNPRVSDKKAESVAMHEIYHHTQKDKGLELGQEEAQANKIEKAYLNENQESTEDLDFDLIYAHTIKQFYEHEELEQLVRALGGDASTAKRVYSNAMGVISEFKDNQKSSNNINYNNSQVKKVVGDSGMRYEESNKKYTFKSDASEIVRNKDLKDAMDSIGEFTDALTPGKTYLDIYKKLDECNKIARKACSSSSNLECLVKAEQWRQSNCVKPTLNETGKELWGTVADTKGAFPNPYDVTDRNITTVDKNVTFNTSISIDNNKTIPKIISSDITSYSTCPDWLSKTNQATPNRKIINHEDEWIDCIHKKDSEIDSD